MKRNKLKEFIKKLVKEYTGTGASGGNAGDGNNITSPRPFPDDMSEIENYILKNVYGAEGGQWVGDKAKSTFNRDPRGGMFELKKYIKSVLEEIQEQAYGSATLTTQGPSRTGAIAPTDEYPFSVRPKRTATGMMEQKSKLQEQVTQAAQRSFEAGLKRLQKGVLRYQLRWIEKQRSAALSQAALAGQQAGKGFDDQIKALQDQIAAIDNPKQQQDGGEQQNENLIKDYINERKGVDLMAYMDSYKRGVLLEGTVRKLFRKFNKGKSNEDIVGEYAKKGIKIPEQFLSKVRKQYESLKKLKLEIDFAEQESKDVITIPTKAPDIQLFDLEPEEEPKKLSPRLFKEQTEKEYEIPPEIKDALENTLKMNPLIRFVESLKAINSIPPSYRIFLLNGQYFDIIYKDAGLMAKIGIDEYYIDHYQENNYAVKHINKLLTQPKMRDGDAEENELEPPDPTAGGNTAGGNTGGPSLPQTPTPKPPPPPKEEPKEEPEDAE